ncbi:protein disulfide-isomerase tmx3 [Anaeramoeba flamelloides]|uniref:Protein disulfide-isomerase tmx3 n=1 Tax=Anaeramoeba flamelloides TaxID=1746091 RepID=A0ABQ8XCP0_9EUKA|nr:protein disulfide-isomerase tmx3 [Anaeramoeba flamelloides]
MKNIFILSFFLLFSSSLFLVNCKNSNDDEYVFTLTKQDFYDLVDPSEFWFLGFFADWCEHCKQIEPQFKTAARGVDGINFGSVNCAKEGSLCRQFKIKGYPTLMFVHGKHRYEYNGVRTPLGMVTFCEKLSQKPVLDLSHDQDSATKLLDTLSHEISTLVLLQDEDQLPEFSFLEAFEQISYELLLELQFVSMTYDSFFTGTEHSSILKEAIRSDEKLLEISQSYDPLDPHRDSETLLVMFRDVNFVKTFPDDVIPDRKRQITKWTKQNLDSILPKLTMNSFEKVTVSNKLVAVAIIDSKKSVSQNFLDIIKEVSKERNDFTFCYLDGRKWSQYIEKFDLTRKMLPKLIVIDYQREIYYEMQSSALGEKYDFIEFLQMVKDKKIQPKGDGVLLINKLKRYFDTFKSWLTDNFKLILCITSCSTTLIYWVFFRNSSNDQKKNDANAKNNENEENGNNTKKTNENKNKNNKNEIEEKKPNKDNQKDNKSKKNNSNKNNKNKNKQNNNNKQKNNNKQNNNNKQKNNNKQNNNKSKKNRKNK